MSLPAYPEYRDSDVDWLGGVPAHWKVVSLKRLVIEPLKYGANAAAEDANHDHPRFVRITDVTSQGSLRDETYRSLPPEVAAPYLLQAGDILLARSGATVGKTFIYRESWGECCFAGYLIRARIDRDKATPEFIYLVLQSSNYWQYIGQEQIQSTIQNVSAERYENFVLPVPPTNEQTQIARFLDHETAKIDTLIHEQKRLIELLKEKRQAVISHAVTKGLDPDVPMKDSGVEWLGEVPAHWEVKRLKHFGRVIGGYAFKSTDFTDEGHPVIKISNVSHLSFDWGDSSYLPESFSFHQKDYIAPKGSLIFAMTRPVISGGIKVAMLTVDINPLINQRVGFMKFDQFALADYVLMSTQSSSFLAQFTNNMTITNQPNISSEGIESISIPVPPDHERTRILEKLGQLVKTYAKGLSITQQQISLLKERRSALISAAVTGKIDVRDWQPPTNESTFGEELRQASLETEA